MFVESLMEFLFLSENDLKNICLISYFLDYSPYEFIHFIIPFKEPTSLFANSFFLLYVGIYFINSCLLCYYLFFFNVLIFLSLL